ncbi:MAG: response regulator [Lachnospiraceae bacterium]|nr:response regulator [Lachnospiraceae bacterium]
MHIAICDDNIADRKQLERLLGRESDKRKASTGVFYVDSFGDCEALAKNPMPYDLFFIDITTGKTDGLDFACELKSAGVTAPIILCSSQIDYRTKTDLLPKTTYEFMHLSKPIITTELSDALDHAILLQQNRIPTIELRSDRETLYVQEDDIVYALYENMSVNVYLKNGTKVRILSTMEGFFGSISMFSHMHMLNEKSLINIAYLEKFSHFSVTLKDGTVIKSTPFAYSGIKSALQMYQSEL